MTQDPKHPRGKPMFDSAEIGDPMNPQTERLHSGARKPAPLEHWAGEGGNLYTGRQQQDALLKSYTEMWQNILHPVNIEFGPESVLEIGANVGLNLDAIHVVDPRIKTFGVEPNANARHIMAGKGHNVIPATMQTLHEMSPGACWDLVFTRGVLIHIPPHDLPAAYETLMRASKRWVVVAEYYNRTPVEIEYRGQMGLLWKRDFAGEMLDRFKDRLRLVDYGFVYHRDPEYPQDDVTWMLMEKLGP